MDGSDASGRVAPRGGSRLVENVVSLFVLQGSNYILPLIAVPYLVRVLGPADYGLLALAQAFAMYFVIFVDYGFELSATREIATLRETGAAISSYVSSVLAVKICLAVLGLAVVLVLVRVVPRFHENEALFLVSYLNVIGTVVFPIWLYRGLQAMKAMSAYTVVARSLSVVAIFVFVHSRADLLRVAFIQASVLLVAGIPALIFAFRLASFRLVVPKPGQVSATLADGWHAFLSTSAITLYTSTNVLMLGLFTSPAAVGYYSAAYKLIQAASGLMSPLSQAVYPHIVTLVARGRGMALAFIGRMFWVQAIITAVISAVLFALAGPLTAILLGSQYHDCVLLLRIMAAAPLVMGLSNLFGIQTMMAFEMKQVFSRIIVGCGVLNVVVLVPLIMAGADAGAAVAVLLVESTAAAAMAVVLQRAGMLAGIVDPRPAMASFTAVWHHVAGRPAQRDRKV